MLNKKAKNAFMEDHEAAVVQGAGGEKELQG